jgi:hypothetical protein
MGAAKVGVVRVLGGFGLVVVHGNPKVWRSSPGNVPMSRRRRKVNRCCSCGRGFAVLSNSQPRAVFS